MKEAIVDNHEWYETLDMLMERLIEAADERMAANERNH